MPIWGTVLLSIAAVLTACGVIWKKVLHPIIIFAATFESNMPVALEIVKEFRSDSGSTLRDQTNRIEKTAMRAEETADRAEQLGLENQKTLHEIQLSLSGMKELSTADRDRIDKFIVLLDRVETLGRTNEASVTAVREDLLESRARADAIQVVTGDSGSAADAAAQGPPT